MSSAIACGVLALVHLSSGYLRFLQILPRSRWLSMAGGASIAYVFVHLLPELAQSQRHLEELESLKWLERHIYLVALAGLVFFYSVERYVRLKRREGAEPTRVPTGVFWLHIASFSLYNALIGYILGRGEEALIPFTLAMALHFMVTDYGLRQDHMEVYQHKGRWVVSAAIVAGWLAAVMIGPIPDAVVGGLTAFVGGGIILNVLKEELPSERESRLSAFFAGVLGYSLILLWA